MSTSEPTAAPATDERRRRVTLAAITVAAGTVGAAVAVAASPALAYISFNHNETLMPVHRHQPARLG
jgi:hypothetical protein